MRRVITIASDDYTSTAKVVELIAGHDGERSIRSVNLQIAGSSASDGFFGLYVADAGKTSLTDAERAYGHLFSDDAVAAAADPTPDLSVGGVDGNAPIDFTLRDGESLYAYWKSGTGDTAVSVDGWVEVR